MTWAKTWLVSFNPKKTRCLLISHKLNKPVHPPLIMDNQVITEVDSHKHLGVFLSNDCTWHKHIDYVKEKAWGRMNVMRRLKFCLDRKSLETICFTFIRPLLEYAIQYNTIQLFYCFISFHMRHSQNTFINMFNINTKNDISFSIMLNKRTI